MCNTQRAWGRARWMLPCRPQAVGSGASGRCMVVGSWASISTKLDAVMRLKCRPFGLIRKRDPLAFTAKEKWFATASCMFSRAAQRKAAAMSTRSVQCDRAGERLGAGAFMGYLLQKASGQRPAAKAVMVSTIRVKLAAARGTEVRARRKPCTRPASSTPCARPPAARICAA